ncbi:hypothetical protein ABFT23_08370 [Nocardioides sp. C4-1]|uniref:hypothetical protein n=1 Tax=Nocardioides sp. C4-1 TaxID=3151851 RepID=UPI003263E39B
MELVAEFVDYPSLKLFWLSGIEAAAFLAAGAYCLSKLREGAWSTVGLIGGLVGGQAALMYAYAWARLEWADDLGPVDAIGSNAVLVQTDWARSVALTLVVASLMLSRRSRRGA